jgi:hypothetical protein
VTSTRYFGLGSLKRYFSGWINCKKPHNTNIESKRDITGLVKVYHSSSLDHQISHVVDFWVQITLEGYIIEFVAENHQALSKAEAIFREGSRGRLLWEIPLWIKVLLVEEGMLHVPSVDMAA